MHSYPIAPWPDPIARPETHRHEVQRELLLELVVDPPEEGEPIALLARRIEHPRAAVIAAAKVLERAGLAEHGPGGLRASRAARSFEALWPTRL